MLLTLLIYVLIFGLIAYAVSLIPLPEPWKTVALVILIVILIVMLLSLVGAFGPRALVLGNP